MERRDNFNFTGQSSGIGRATPKITPGQGIGCLTPTIAEIQENEKNGASRISEQCARDEKKLDVLDIEIDSKTQCKKDFKKIWQN